MTANVLLLVCLGLTASLLAQDKPNEKSTKRPPPQRHDQAEEQRPEANRRHNGMHAAERVLLLKRMMDLPPERLEMLQATIRRIQSLSKPFAMMSARGGPIFSVVTSTCHLISENGNRAASICFHPMNAAPTSSNFAETNIPREGMLPHTRRLAAKEHQRIRIRRPRIDPCIRCFEGFSNPVLQGVQIRGG